MSYNSTYLDCVAQFRTELKELRHRATTLNALYIDIDAFARLERDFVPSEAQAMKPSLVVINDALDTLSAAWRRLAEKEGVPADPAPE